MKQAPSKIATLASLAGVIFSVTTIHASITCQPGTYTFTLNGSDCQVCPPGTYTDMPGLIYCKPCLDTIYEFDGANSAQVWNDDLYCVYLGKMNPTLTSSPSSIQVADRILLDAPSQMSSSRPSTMPSKNSSEAPSQMPSSSPRASPSSTPSTVPSPIASSQQTTESVSLVGTQHNNTNSILELATDNSKVCDPSEDGNFEWHGKCKQCPADYEAILYPFLALFLLALFIVLLQYLLPSCFTALFWWGLEYIQMLYLIRFLPITWSPIANTVFEKFLSLFALDLNASFSVQCVMGDNWQKEADMMLIISLPIIAFIVLTFLSKISRGRIIRDESVSRLMAIVIYVGYLNLVLSSLEVLEFPVLWSADDLSIWVNSDPFYSTLGGIAGLLFYGLAFPFWFLQNLGKYYRLAHNEVERDGPVGQDVENGAKRSKRHLIKKEAKKKKEIFMTLGVFPTTLRPVAWWWPGFLMFRKFILAVLLVIFKDSLFLLLVIFLVTHLLGLIAHQCCMPHFKESNRKWYHTATVNTVLQLCLIVMVGVVFLSCWSVDEDMMRDFFQKWTEDILVCIFIPSLIYLCLAIGVACAQAEPSFKATASNMVKKNIATKGGCDNTGAVPSSTESLSTQTASSQGSSNEASVVQKEIDFFIDVDREEWKQTVDYDDWIAKGALSVMEEDYDDEKLFAHGRADSTTDAATNDLDIDIEAFVDDDDMGTIYEDVWVDESTGEEILDPKSGNWIDAETGMLAVSLDN